MANVGRMFRSGDELRTDLGLETLAILTKAPDEASIGRRSGVMPGAPSDHLEHDRQEVDALQRKPIPSARSTNRRFFFDDAVLLETQKPIRKDVGRDAFLRAQEIRIPRPSLEHEVANDQQRPRVAEHLEREVYRTVRSPLTPFHRWPFDYLRFASPFCHSGLQK